MSSCSNSNTNDDSGVGASLENESLESLKTGGTATSSASSVSGGSNVPAAPEFPPPPPQLLTDDSTSQDQHSTISYINPNYQFITPNQLQQGVPAMEPNQSSKNSQQGSGSSKPRRKLPEIPPRQVSLPQNSMVVTSLTSDDLSSLQQQQVHGASSGEEEELEDKFEIFSRFLQSQQQNSGYSNTSTGKIVKKL